MGWEQKYIKWAKYFREFIFETEWFSWYRNNWSRTNSIPSHLASARVNIRFFDMRLRFDFYWKIYSIILRWYISLRIWSRTYIIILRFIFCIVIKCDALATKPFFASIHPQRHRHACIYLSYLVGCLIYKMSTWFFLQSHKFNIFELAHTHTRAHAYRTEKFWFGRHEMKANVSWEKNWNNSRKS